MTNALTLEKDINANTSDDGFVLENNVVTQPSGKQIHWSVDISKLIPLLVKEIQDLRVRVAALEG